MNGSGSRIYRDRALEHGSVRERLDQRVPVVGLPRWIALGVGALALVGIVAWSASRHVETTLAGDGIFASQRGIHVVAAPIAGTVKRRLPQTGTAVEAGEPLTRLDPGRGQPVAVEAPLTGTVSSVSAAPGTFVSPGGELATVDPQGRGQAVLFIPFKDAERVNPGMEVRLSPDVAPSQAASLIKAEVGSVGTYPSSPARLELVLGPGLAPQFQSGPPVVEVGIRLVRDGSTPSGLAWTRGSGSGPLPLHTPLSGEIVISSKSPFSLVF
jgi:HlyD family secretion protein